MSRSRFDTMVGTAILAAICAAGGLLSNMVPSPYVETAEVIDPIMDRLPATQASHEGSAADSWTLTRAQDDLRRADEVHYVN